MKAANVSPNRVDEWQFEDDVIRERTQKSGTDKNVWKNRILIITTTVFRMMCLCSF